MAIAMEFHGVPEGVLARPYLSCVPDLEVFVRDNPRVNEDYGR